MLDIWIIGIVAIGLLIFDLIGVSRKNWSFHIIMNSLSILSILPTYMFLKLIFQNSSHPDSVETTNGIYNLLSLGPLSVFAIISFLFSGWLIFRIYSTLL